MVWEESRRFGLFAEFGGEGTVFEGKIEDDVVREREWDEEAELACWAWPI
jgi:hypothetical protein